MATGHVIGNEGAVEESAENQLEMAVVDEVAERERNLAPSVEQAAQAKIDHADDHELNGRLFGQTLEAEERMRAREWEIERTRSRWDREQDSDREARCREAATGVSRERRADFQRRAACVDPWAAPDKIDARERLSRAELAAVNREATRMAAVIGGFSSAAVSRLLARRVIDGLDLPSAVVTTADQLRTAPGQVVPLGSLDDVQQRDVDVEGRVVQLWDPSTPNARQVGLLADDTGRVKFTAWRRSRMPVVREGERVRFRNAAVNWYRGRVSVALTGWSRVVRLE